MNNRITYTPCGVCSRRMEVTFDGGRITGIEIEGGCHGNLQGICALVKGMEAREVAGRLTGIDCKGKGTSCPDQLAKAITEYLGR